MNPSLDRLKQDLKNIGVSQGDVLVVHSSFKSMGHVEGGAACVIDALKAAVGEEGTLVFPTFTYATSCESSFFSNTETPSCVGYLSEFFRKSEGVLRTNHPTHSVAIWGALRDALNEGVELDDTPMGPHAPYRKFAGYGAKILMLGCSLSHNSILHAVEELAELPYVLRQHQEFTVVDSQGNVTQRRIRRHNFNRPDGRCILQRYDRTLDVLSEGDYSIAQIHGAQSILLSSAALVEKALKKLQQDPLYFIDDPHGLYAHLRKNP